MHGSMEVRHLLEGNVGRVQLRIVHSVRGGIHDVRSWGNVVFPVQRRVGYARPAHTNAAHAGATDARTHP
jgi:hypothetical protein